MVDLKPCPFCGGEAVFMCGFDGKTTIECINCRVLMDNSIAAWNTRAERTCEYIGDEISGGCSECRGWLDPGCAYCPSCGRKVVGE